MMKTILFLLTVLCVNSVFGQSDDKANILALERSAANAFTKHDVPALNTAYSDDVSAIGTNGALLTKQQLIESTQKINSRTVSDMQVRIEGYIAIVTGVELETGKDDNGVYSNKIRFTDILQKTKGIWKIISSQLTIVQ